MKFHKNLLIFSTVFLFVVVAILAGAQTKGVDAAVKKKPKISSAKLKSSISVNGVRKLALGSTAERPVYELCATDKINLTYIVKANSSVTGVSVISQTSDRSQGGKPLKYDDKTKTWRLSVSRNTGDAHNKLFCTTKGNKVKLSVADDGKPIEVRAYYEKDCFGPECKYVKGTIASKSIRIKVQNKR